MPLRTYAACCYATLVLFACPALLGALLPLAALLALYGLLLLASATRCVLALAPRGRRLREFAAADAVASATTRGDATSPVRLMIVIPVLLETDEDIVRSTLVSYTQLPRCEEDMLLTIVVVYGSSDPRSAASVSAAYQLRRDWNGKRCDAGTFQVMDCSGSLAPGEKGVMVDEAVERVLRSAQEGLQPPPDVVGVYDADRRPTPELLAAAAHLFWRTRDGTAGREAAASVGPRSVGAVLKGVDLPLNDADVWPNMCAVDDSLFHLRGRPWSQPVPNALHAPPAAALSGMRLTRRAASVTAAPLTWRIEPESAPAHAHQVMDRARHLSIPARIECHVAGWPLLLLAALGLRFLEEGGGGGAWSAAAKIAVFCSCSACLVATWCLWVCCALVILDGRLSHANGDAATTPVEAAAGLLYPLFSVWTCALEVFQVVAPASARSLRDLRADRGTVALEALRNQLSVLNPRPSFTRLSFFANTSALDGLRSGERIAAAASAAASGSASSGEDVARMAAEVAEEFRLELELEGAEKKKC